MLRKVIKEEVVEQREYYKDIHAEGRYQEKPWYRVVKVRAYKEGRVM